MTTGDASGDATPSAGGTVSVVIPVRDEIHRMPAVLASVEAQTRFPDEVLVVDGMSTDGTGEWCRTAARTRPWLKVLDNPERVVPAALNVGLRHAEGDVWARMDAHAHYPEDYLERCLSVLRDRPEVVGVGSVMTTAGQGRWGRSIAAVLSRRIGLGGAQHRVDGRSGVVPHVFTGAYRRSALVAVGGYDPRLLANEDYEADHRVSEHVGALWLDSSIRSTWYVRESPRALSVQMWRYGFYKALTLTMHPGSLRARQLAPPALLLSLLAATLVRPRSGAALALAYASVAGAAGARAARSDGASAWRAAVVVPVVHLSWGAGLLAGGLAHRLRYGWRITPVAPASTPTADGRATA